MAPSRLTSIALALVLGGLAACSAVLGIEPADLAPADVLPSRPGDALGDDAGRLADGGLQDPGATPIQGLPVDADAGVPVKVATFVENQTLVESSTGLFIYECTNSGRGLLRRIGARGVTIAGAVLNCFVSTSDGKRFPVYPAIEADRFWAIRPVIVTDRVVFSLETSSLDGTSGTKFTQFKALGADWPLSVDPTGRAAFVSLGPDADARTLARVARLTPSDDGSVVHETASIPWAAAALHRTASSLVIATKQGDVSRLVEIDDATGVPAELGTVTGDVSTLASGLGGVIVTTRENNGLARTLWLLRRDGGAVVLRRVTTSWDVYAASGDALVWVDRHALLRLSAEGTSVMLPAINASWVAIYDGGIYWFDPSNSSIYRVDLPKGH